jgi:ABC-type bacteriocin/lantibiotic exporter with double-glycine peptidase domain
MGSCISNSGERFYDIEWSALHEQRFWLLLKPDEKEIYQVYTYAFFKGVIALSLPIGIQSIINLIQGGVVSVSWLILVLIVVTGIAMGGYMQIMQMRITETIQQKIFAYVEIEL